jgi:signal transduction histidine kinase
LEKRRFSLRILDWALAHTICVTVLAMFLIIVIFFGLGRMFGVRQSVFLQFENLVEAGDLIQETIKNYELLLQRNNEKLLNTNEFGIQYRKMLSDIFPDLRVQIQTNPGNVDPAVWGKVVTHQNYFMDIFRDRIAEFAIDGESGYSLHAYFPLISKEKENFGKVYGLQNYTVPVERFVNKKTKYGNNLTSAWALVGVQYVGVFAATFLVYLLFYLAKKLISKLNFLNENLEKIVLERTHEIEKRHTEISSKWIAILEKREQMVLDEKMAALGIVTTDIARNLREPIGQILDLTRQSQTCLSKLKEVITLKSIDEIELNLKTMMKHNIRTEKIISTMAQQKHDKTSHKTEEHLGKVFVNVLNDIEKIYLSGNKPAYEFPKIKLEVTNNLKSCLMCVHSLEKVIDNLFMNAVYAIFQRFKKSAYQRGMIAAEILQSEHELIFSFKDNGIGIAPENLPMIYQPFYTTKPAGMGVGLGLALTYDIVTNEHAGTMRIDSEPDAGTSVLIRIPFASAAT